MPDNTGCTGIWLADADRWRQATCALKGFVALPGGKKQTAFFVLAVLSLGTVATVVTHHHSVLLVLPAIWFSTELFLWRRERVKAVAPKSIHHKRKNHERSPFPALDFLFEKGGPGELLQLEEEILSLKREEQIEQTNKRELDRLQQLVEFHKLLSMPQCTTRRKIRRLFIVNSENPEALDPGLFERIEPQDVVEAATVVAGMYRAVADVAENPASYYRFYAQTLLRRSFHHPYEKILLDGLPDRCFDQMQTNQGVSFLVLNLIRRKEWASARLLGQRLLKEEWGLDEEMKASLYWLGELAWFQQNPPATLNDYETSLRYLYHICFAAPERARFLEIDSPYFSQFETINELAREAFQFKENLISRFLEMWEQGQGLFDQNYIEVLEILTGLRSKIYEDCRTWKRVWGQEEASFGKDFLFVVEGNISYARGEYDDARVYYEKALNHDAGLRAALLNVPFVYAALGKQELLEWSIQRIVSMDTLLPENLHVAGNAFLIAGADRESDFYYEQLRNNAGWGHKVDLNRSVFCLDHGLKEKALLFSRVAYERKSDDPNVIYHLSLCYNAVGETEKALELVKKVNETPHWLDYYRFTLERDAGKCQEATETLLKMPPHYFDDPEELEEAITFARTQRDLRLLRHLKAR